MKNDRWIAGQRRRAFTVIELLAVLGIIAVLVSILLSAVQSARESARRRQCADKLRAIGLAISQYETSHRVFPPGTRAFLFLLPYLGQESLYRQIDFSRPWTEVEEKYKDVRLSAFDCPSDPVDVSGRTNYAACAGRGLVVGTLDGLFRNVPGRSGPNSVLGGPVRAAEVRDGLSHTVAVSEILPDGTLEDNADRLRGIWVTPETLKQLGGPDEFMARCDGVPDRPGRYGWKSGKFRGYSWAECDMGRAKYNHALTPNRPSCTIGGDVQFGIYTAASLHPGGVLTLMGDGRVTFVPESIDVQVWRAAATISGSEPFTFSY